MIALASAMPWLASQATADSQRIYRIGLLTAGIASDEGIQTFIAELAKRGFVQGKNVVYEVRANPPDRPDGVTDAARDLAARKVDIIVAMDTSGSALAAKAATSTIPIVFFGVTDPVGVGLVESLAHPGGNVTGLGLSGADLAGATVSLFIEALGKPTPRIGDIQPRAATSGPGYVQMNAAALAAARKLGASYEYVDVDAVEEVEPALRQLVAKGVDGIVLGPWPMFRPRLREIAGLLVKYRLPSLGLPTAGFLMSYNADLSFAAKRSADYVDKILKGAHPSTLPVELPTRFILSVNLRTAKAIGLALPKSLLVRADTVIQ